ncbi:response regulator [Massilia eurypsychrophila]|uniref:Response regulator n=1 Tax=Massilia eurypsychrophila TaxID=1485217 RepID=A0A2G8TD67_9BURK|nr:response regulator [Massilia eurypsychrophila]
MPVARILIIEDNPTNMELMSYLLSAFGHTPLMAFDGESGVRLAQAELPDLILCDVHLPKLDGYGVVAQLKADPQLRRTPVLAVTALAMLGDRERLLAAGFDGYIGKPIEPEQFVGELGPFLVPLVAPFPLDAPAAGTLLIVDDDPFMVEILRDFLAQDGYTIVSASNAADAIALVAGGSVQVVACDQCMPLMSGTAFFERARQLRPHCYRIMLTALADSAAVTLAIERGDIDRCFPKPWDGAELRAAVREGFAVQARRAA